MIAKIPKRLEAYSIQIDSSNLVKKYNLKEMDQLFVSVIPPTNTKPLIGNQFEKFCMRKVCCEFFVKYSTHDIPHKKFGYTYRFSIESDERDGESHCAIVACTTDEKCGSRFFPSDNLVPSVKFSEIRVSMTIELRKHEEEDLMVMPSNVDFWFVPLSADRFDYTAGRVFNESG
jgi:hypothetical protein